MKIIDLSITNWQNCIFNGSIIIDLGKNYRILAIIDLNHRTLKVHWHEMVKVFEFEFFALDRSILYEIL